MYLLWHHLNQMQKHLHLDSIYFKTRGGNYKNYKAFITVKIKQ